MIDSFDHVDFNSIYRVLMLHTTRKIIIGGIAVAFRVQAIRFPRGAHSSASPGVTINEEGWGVSDQ